MVCGFEASPSQDSDIFEPQVHEKDQSSPAEKAYSNQKALEAALEADQLALALTKHPNNLVSNDDAII